MLQAIVDGDVRLYGEYVTRRADSPAEGLRMVQEKRRHLGLA